MKRQQPPELNMTLEGEFVSPPTAPIATRIMFWAIVIAVIAGGLTLAALALWIAMLVLPIAVGAAVVGYIMFRYRMWRARQMHGANAVWSPPPRW